MVIQMCEETMRIMKCEHCGCEFRWDARIRTFPRCPLCKSIKTTTREKMTEEPISDEQIREVVDKCIEVYYTRSPETNHKREEEKAETINWLISEYRKGACPEGVRGQLPDFTYTFGDSSIWDAIRRMVLLCQPKCAICGEPVKEIHHIRPKFLGGINHPRNVIGLCLKCHDQVHRNIDLGIAEVISKSVPVTSTQLQPSCTLDEFVTGNKSESE